MHADHDEGYYGDRQQYVRGEAVAVLGGHAAGVEEEKECNGEERQEQRAEGGVDDHERDRLPEGVEDHGGR